MNGKKIKGALE